MTEEVAQAQASTEQAAPAEVKVTSLLFNKWDISDIKVNDPALVRYVSVNSHIVPHCCGRKQKQQFSKSEMLIVERLINRLMQTENNTGKKELTTRIVEQAFDIVYKKEKRNPVEVLVDAIANAGPREETVRLKYGGINVPKSVDTAPQRRIDTALFFIAKAVQQGSSKKKRAASAVLAEELILASKGDTRSYSVAKKEERERVAKSAR